MAVAEPMGHLARRHLQGGEEIDDPVPLIVVRVAHGAAGPHGQRRLRALQSLDGRLLVDTEDNGVFGWVEIESDHIGHLGRKLRIPTHVVGAGEMGLDAVGSQDIGHTATCQSDRVAQQPGRPSAPSGGGRRQGELDDPFDGPGDRLWGGPPGRPRPPGQTGAGSATPLRATARDAPRSPRRRPPRRSTERRGLPCARHQRFEHPVLFPCRADLVCVRHTRIRSHA